MVFQKGVSGNPSGRKKLAAKLWARHRAAIGYDHAFVGER